MSIFTTPLSQLTFADLQELLQNSAVENIRLEFKSEVPDKNETLKKLSSFANTFGGFVVIGAKADSADGRLVELPGVALQNSYKQQVVQWCFDGASPPLTIEVSDPIPHASEAGKAYYVLYIPESDLAPHFLNERKGVWVRTDEFSQHYKPQLADENEILHLLDRRRLIQQRRIDLVKRSQHRFERLLSRPVTEDKNQVSSRSAARIELSVGPRFPARPVYEQAHLAEDMRNCRINWRGTTFPLSNANFVSQHESALFLTPRDSRNRVGLVEANIWGMLFYGTELDIEIAPQGTRAFQSNPISGIHLYRLVGHLLVFIEHATKMISRFSYEGTLSIDMTLSGILGVPLLYTRGDNVMYKGPISELDDDFSFSLPTTSEALRKQSDGLVMSMLQYILFGMNWPEYASSADSREALMRSGYEYNFWPEPKVLRV